MPVASSDAIQTARQILSTALPGSPDARAAGLLIDLVSPRGRSAHEGRWRQREAPVHVTASVMLVHPSATPARDRVLLTSHPKLGRWMQLGGHLEEGDGSLREAAARETLEESGQEHDPSTLVLLGAGLFHRVRCRQPGEGPSTHLDVRYLAVTEHPAFTRSHESLDLRWFPLTQLPTPHDEDLTLLADQAGTAMGRLLSR